MRARAAAVEKANEVRRLLVALLALAVVGCNGPVESETERERIPAAAATAPAPETETTIHVFVALCDNDSQGIVPVPRHLGDGDDPKGNLYWGAMYGTRTFLERSDAWDLVATADAPGEAVLERVVLRHPATGAYLVADAYRGSRIRQAVEAFLDAAAGNSPQVWRVGQAALGIHGAAELVAYVGHNGLMEFEVACPPRGGGVGGRAAVVLACRSRPYFQPLLGELGCRPMLLTTGLMAPEAYTLEAVLEAWLAGQDAAGLRDAAAGAYGKYQKCGLRAAKRLFHAE